MPPMSAINATHLIGKEFSSSTTITRWNCCQSQGHPFVCHSYEHFKWWSLYSFRLIKCKSQESIYLHVTKASAKTMEISKKNQRPPIHHITLSLPPSSIVTPQLKKLKEDLVHIMSTRNLLSIFLCFWFSCIFLFISGLQIFVSIWIFPACLEKSAPCLSLEYQTLCLFFSWFIWLAQKRGSLLDDIRIVLNIKYNPQILNPIPLWLYFLLMFQIVTADLITSLYQYYHLTLRTIQIYHNPPLPLYTPRHTKSSHLLNLKWVK